MPHAASVLESKPAQGQVLPRAPGPALPVLCGACTFPTVSTSGCCGLLRFRPVTWPRDIDECCFLYLSGDWWDLYPFLSFLFILNFLWFPYFFKLEMGVGWNRRVRGWELRNIEDKYVSFYIYIYKFVFLDHLPFSEFPAHIYINNWEVALFFNSRDRPVSAFSRCAINIEIITE